MMVQEYAELASSHETFKYIPTHISFCETTDSQLNSFCTANEQERERDCREKVGKLQDLQNLWNSMGTEGMVRTIVHIFPPLR